MTSPGINQAIKSTIARLGPHTKPNQIVQALSDLGIDVSETHISRIKMQMLRDQDKAESQRAQKPVKDRRKKRPQQRKIPGRCG